MDHLKGRVTLSLKCDVTNAKDVTKLRDSVESLVSKNDWKLWALINNAGMNCFAYVSIYISSLQYEHIHTYIHECSSVFDEALTYTSIRL